ncbi:hypothetical protein BH09BAC6_BH09BAC6_13320 [soil metagenome]
MFNKQGEAYIKLRRGILLNRFYTGADNRGRYLNHFQPGCLLLSQAKYNNNLMP